MNIQEILDRVKQHQDINYKKFSEKIIREKKLIGVRTPVLESISASIIKDDPLSYLIIIKKTVMKWILFTDLSWQSLTCQLNNVYCTVIISYP